MESKPEDKFQEKFCKSMIDNFSRNYLEVVRKKKRILIARIAEESDNMQSEIINVVYKQNETEKN